MHGAVFPYIFNVCCCDYNDSQFFKSSFDSVLVTQVDPPQGKCSNKVRTRDLSMLTASALLVDPVKEAEVEVSEVTNLETNVAV